MLPAQIKTASWFDKLPDDHMRIGISRGVPRNLSAGYRVFRKLAPGPWFNSVSAVEYYRLYKEGNCSTRVQLMRAEASKRS